MSPRRVTGGPRARPHQAQWGPVFLQEVPGADPASPVLTPPPHPAWPELPSTPVATWPGPQAGGAGKDGRWPGSLRRDALRAVRAAPHEARATSVLGGDRGGRGPSAPRAGSWARSVWRGLRWAGDKRPLAALLPRSSPAGGRTLHPGRALLGARASAVTSRPWGWLEGAREGPGVLSCDAPSVLSAKRR